MRSLGELLQEVTSAQSEPAVLESRAEAGRFRLWRVEDLLKLPPPEWLIDGLVQTGAQGVVYGPTAHGRTFLALDWALSVAVGRQWHGRAVRKGPVVYIASEGGRAMQMRVAAWMQHHSIAAIDDGYFVLQAVQLRNQRDRDEFLQRLRELCPHPALIVIDTFARCFVGGDENTSKDVGEFVDAMGVLQEQTKTAMLLVHHTGKDADKERGSSALRGAADFMFKVMRNPDGVITLKNEKQKDEEVSSDTRLTLQTVDLPRYSNGTKAVRSCVLVCNV